MTRLPPVSLLLLVISLGLGATPAAAATPSVSAALETPALFDDAAGGDADADDPAIWVHPTDPASTLVIGTKKNGGLDVYGIDGRLRQSIAVRPAPRKGDEEGRLNNVDVLTDVRVGGPRRDLAVVTDRGRDQLRIYAIDAAAAQAGRPPLSDVTVADAPLVFSADLDAVQEQATAYGLSTFRSRGRGYATVSQRSRTRLRLLRLVPAEDGRVSYRGVDSLRLPARFRLPNGRRWMPCDEPGALPQIEGQVVDRARGILFAGQEAVGLWRVPVSARGGFGTPRLIERVREYGVPGTYDAKADECEPGADPGFGGRRITADLEGLTIAAGLLLISSQGDSTFHALRDRGRGRYAGSFRIGDGAVDGVQESDGAQAVTAPLPGYPGGLLVTHDGENTPAPGKRESTNFKFTRFDEVLAALARR